jgi:hypothetical protein
MFILAGVLGTQVLLAGASTPLPNHSNIYVKCANTEGISFDPGNNGGYYIQALASSGGGFNAIHITTDPSISMGQATVSTNQSGTFYAMDTGGRGYQDDVILMLAVNGTIPADFQVHIHASGYSWTPSGVVNAAPAPGTMTYKPSSLDETFTADQFIYGPQDWKPAGGDANYPIFVGEDMNNSGNMFQIMFIDTHVGLVGTNYPYGGDKQFISDGAVKVDYTFTDLPSFAAFNIYAWNWATTQGQGMLWTNRILLPSGASSPNGGSNDNPVSGYSILGIPIVSPSPVPSPSTTPTPTFISSPTPIASPTVSAEQNSTLATATPTEMAGVTATTAPGQLQATPAPTASGSSSTSVPVSGKSSATPSISYTATLLLFAGTAMLAVNSRRMKK